MASPSASTSTLNFVKKYPIVLCGFSLLFMPSVHRLLLYFTPLLLSTAIFIVAMMGWGPASTSSERGRRRSKKKLGTHEEYQAFHGSFKMNDHEEEEEEEEEEDEEVEPDDQELHMQQEEISQKGNAAIKDYMQQHEYISQIRKTGSCIINAEPDPDLKRQEAAELEPDPDLAAEEGTVSSEAYFTLQCGGQAEPDPDLQTDCVGSAAPSGRLGGQAEPDPDLQRDSCVGTASNSASAEPHAESDPDLHAEPDVPLQNCPAAEPPSAVTSDDLHAQMNLDQPGAAPHQDHDQHAEESADDDHQLYAGSDNIAEQEGDLHAAVLAHKLKGVIRKAPCTAASDDPHDMELAAARAAVERLEASLGISGSSSGSSHQRAPEYCLQAPLHAAA